MDRVDIFQKQIYKKYKRFKIKQKKLTFKQICYPSKYTFQLPQLFVSNYMDLSTKNKGLLLYHKIGAGKTCAAVKIAENFKGKRNIIMTCPASLVGNFYKEIRSECTSNEYMNESIRNKLKSLDVQSREYKTLINSINDKIDQNYQIYSYNKIADLLFNRKLRLDNSLLVIDEVQNIVSEHGSYYKILLGAIMKASNLRIVIMSATPIFDKPMELGLTLNMITSDNSLFEVGNKFNEKYIDYKIIDNEPIYSIKNTQQLRLKLNGLVSYFSGAPSYVFPERRQKIIKCPMSRYQYDSYKIVQRKEGKINKLDLLKLPNNFFIGSRIISNIAFPNKLVNKAGLNALTRRLMDMDNLQTYSTKYYEIMKRILKSSGTIFVYSNFREYGGLMSFIKILEHYQFKNFLNNGKGRNRYAVWSGDETMEQKEKLKEVFNSKANHNGSQIKIILGSPAIKEGVSLLRVRHVHIIEPYWNMSRLEQVIGRAIRFCSHKDVEIEKRYVKVYIYIATIPEELAAKERRDNIDPTITVDEHIYNMAIAKQNLNAQFEQVIQDAAIDYKLFQE